MSSYVSEGPPTSDLGLGDLTQTTDVNVVNERLLSLRNNPRIHLIGPGIHSLVKLEMIPQSYAVDWHCFMFDPTLDDPDANPPIKGPHVYREKNWDQGVVALKRSALLELWTSSAGQPVHSERVDDGHEPHYCCWRWIGKATGMSGEPVVKVGTIESDLRDGSERAKQLKGGVSKARMHIVSTTESRAQNKAIREALGIAQTYTLENVRYPFVLMKLVFRPNMEDPMIRFLVTAHAIGASNAIFGGPTGAELVRQLLTAKPEADEPKQIEAPKHPAEAQKPAVNPSPVAEAPKPQPPSVTQPQNEPLPFEALPQPGSSPTIRSFADYEALESKCNNSFSTPAMVEALEELKIHTKYPGAFAKPFKDWLPGHRRAFVRQQLGLPK